MGPKAPALNSAPFELLRLDNQLCFALYAATRVITKTYRERLHPMGLTYPQYLVLLVLWEDNNLTVAQIGNKLMLDSGTLTPLLKRLEAMGIVNRTRSVSDERNVLIELTAVGEKLRAEALEARKHVACRLDMSEAEIMALRSDIMGLVGRLGQGCEVEAAE